MSSSKSTSNLNLQHYFVNRKVLVTGAGKGIGRALSKELHALGAKVFCVSRTRSDLDSLEAECPGVSTILLDLLDWKKTEEVLGEQLNETMDVVINNAGVGGENTFLHLTEENFDTVFGVNLKAVVNVSQIFAKKMIAASKSGDIVNISSICAFRPFSDAPLYCATKAGVDMMTKCMAIDLGKHNIRVNSINMGFVKTAMDDHDLMEKMYMHRMPMGKIWIDMEEAVRGILFIASGSIKMLTGSGFTLDGGFLAV